MFGKKKPKQTSSKLLDRAALATEIMLQKESATDKARESMYAFMPEPKAPVRPTDC